MGRDGEMGVLYETSEGKRIENVVIPSESLVTAIDALCNLTICLTIVSPKPAPPNMVERDFSTR